MRVLHDWFGCMNVPRSFWKGMREAGVEVKAVNPPASGPPLGAIRRDHRKLLAVDGEYASTGGVCIADGWMVRSKETGLPYRDTAVSVRGPVVADINRAFTSLWGELVEELPDDERPDPKDIQAAGETPARLVVQEPRRMRTLRMLELLTAGVQERLWITDPYFLSTTDPHPVADGHGARRRRREGPHAGHRRHSLDRQGLARGLPAVPGGGGQDLRVRRTHDPRQDHRGRRLVVEGGLDEPELQQPGRQLGDRPGGGGRRTSPQQMEQLFEDDISNSREVRLEGSGQRPRVRPDRRVDTSDSRARAGVVGSGTGSGATVSRVVPTLVQKGAAPLQTHEHALAAAASGALLGASLLGARFPRLVAWPLDGGWRVSRGPWRSCARSNRRSPTAGRSRVRRSEGRTKWNETEIQTRRSRNAAGPSNRSVVAVAGNRPAPGSTARRKNKPVDPRAERRPAADRSGAGSLRELLLPARAPLRR